MTKISSKNQMLLVDTLLTGLLSSMVLITLAPLTPLSLPTFSTILFLSLLSALTVLLLTRKVIILPILSAILIIAFLFLLSTGDLSLYLSDLRIVILDGPDNALHPTIINSVIFFSGLILSLLIFAFNRKLYTFFVPLIICSLSAIRLYFSGSSYFYPSLVILLFIIFISLAKSRGKAHAKLLSEDIEKSRAYHSITAIIMILLVLMSTIFISPKEDGQWQSARLVQATDDVSSLLRLDRRRQSMSGVFDVRFTGYQPLGHRLGGDISPDHTIVMTLYTLTPTLLIGSYRDTYDGQMWHNTVAHTTFRYDALILRGERNRVFLNKIPMGGEEFEDLYNRIVTDGQYRIYSLVFGRSIFFAGRVNDIYDTDFDRDLLSFNDHGELFIDTTSRRGMNYKMNTTYIDRFRPRFDQHIMELERLAENFHDPYYEQIAENYLQLPDSLPQDVYDLTLQITNPEMSPYQNALSIETWLSENCVYTLTPGTPPEGEDFVSYFLQTREGYCVYFASAMTVMARCIGLPSRYVHGFSLLRGSDSDSTYFIATNSSAHVWTEIYFEGIGWVPFDAATVFFDSAHSIDTEIHEMINLPLTITPSPSITSEDMNLEDTDETLRENDSIDDSVIKILKYLLLLLIIIIVILKAIYLMIDNPLYRRIHLNSKLSNKEKLDRLFSRSMTQLSLAGLPLLPGETLNEYIARTQNNDTLISSKQDWEPIMKMKMLPGETIDEYMARTQNNDILISLEQDWEPVIKMKYANIMPSNEDVENLYALCIKLEKWMPPKCGLPKYFVHRIIKSR